MARGGAFTGSTIKSSRGFVHLHVHSPFSFLDGASHISSLVEKAAALGMDCLAITDHMSLSGAVRFTREALKRGIRPVLGAELTLENGHHLTILCKDETGYRNLCRILTESHLKSDRRSPQVSMNCLIRYKDGLIVLSGCRRGEIPWLILRKRFSEAKAACEKLVSAFGRDSFYLEMSESALPGSSGLNKALEELGAEFKIGVVATNNVHYANKEDFPVHDVLTCIRTLTKISQVSPERRLNAENYLKSSEEMAAEFRDYPRALETSRRIAEECHFTLPLGKPNFPSFPVPPGMSSAEYLRKLVYDGALERYGRITGDISGRLDGELHVITKLGYEDYFLVVWDLVEFARRSGIRHAGRGSAADSAVAYCLGITDVDAIRQGLLFERFLSLERGEKPDIDVDFDARRRDEVTKYAYEKYGEDHVACVATYNTFQARAAIREAGKVLEFPQELLDVFAKRLPHISAEDIERALESVPELKALHLPEEKVGKLVDIAKKLADLPRHLGTHLGGIVISRDPITWISPVQVAAKGVTIVPFDKEDVEELGLVKIDLLCLRTLGAVDDALEYISNAKRFRGEKPLDYLSIPLDDGATYARLRTGETVGVFQLESPAQRALQTRLGADNVEDVVSSVALIRPGPIKGDMVSPFISRRRGLEPVTYLDDRLEPILKKTYGVILFQEQVIEIATVIGGFTPGEADNLRKLMTHKRSEREMAEMGELFVEKAVARGTSPEVAKAVFQKMLGYASYGFCEAHARAFATTAYKTAYLVEHYPAEFFAAVLNNEPMGFYPVSTICVEARKRRVKILGPSVNKSFKDVTVEGRSIRLPLKMVKDVPSSLIDSIVTSRSKRGEFRSFQDFVERTGAQRDALRSLILAGAFDELGLSRKGLLWSVEKTLAVEEAGKSAGGITIPLFNEIDIAGDDFSLAEKIAFEYETLGMGVSGHPAELWRPLLRRKGYKSSGELEEVKPGALVKVAGIPVRPHRPPTKSGRTVVFLSLEDEAGLIDVTVFENVYHRYGKYLFPGELIPLAVWGKLQKRGEGLSVLAQCIMPLNDVLH